MPDPTLYLFDGHNLLHAGGFADARELADRLASFVALRGARGVVVFDGAGVDEQLGPLEVRYARHADTLLERLAAERRATEEVCLVSSDAVVRHTAGIDVQKRSTRNFLPELAAGAPAETRPGQLRDRLSPEVLARLERMRRGEA